MSDLKYAIAAIGGPSVKPENPESPEKPETGHVVALSGKKDPAGTWTLIALMATALAVGLYGGGFRPLYESMRALLTGSGAEIAQSIATPLQIITVGGFTIPMMIVVALIIAETVQMLIGKAEHGQMFENIREKHIFAGLFLTVLCEELFARWLMIGVIGHFWTGKAALYTLFIVGNTIWAALHYFNVKKKEQRNLLRTLPQFAGGIILTAVYLQFGFMAVLMIHLAYDVVLFASDKKMPWRKVSAKIAVWNIGLAGAALLAALFVTHTDLTAIKVWLGADPQFTVQGWNTADYIVCVLFYSALASVILEVLAIDYANVGSLETAVKEFKHASHVVIALIVIALTPLFYLLTYKMLGLVMHDTAHQVMVAVLLLVTLSSSGVSGSALARSFITSGVSFLIVCGILGLPFWGGVLLMLVVTAGSLPDTLMIVRDHRQLIPDNPEEDEEKKRRVTAFLSKHFPANG